MTTLAIIDRSRGLTIAQLLLSIMGITGSLISMVILSAILVSRPALAPITSEQTSQLHNFLWIIGLTILITIPSLVYSIRRLSGKPSSSILRRRFLLSSLALLLMLPLILLGKNVVNDQNVNGVSTVLNILLVVIPLWWFLELGRLQLIPGSPQRQWGLSVFSIYLTLPIVLLVELILIIISLGFGLFWLMQQPEFAPLINQLEQQFALNPLGLQNLGPDLEPLLLRPEVIIAGILGVVLVIPLIEELLKNLALWFLVKHDLTPGEGFTAGLICGASFALLESVFSLTAVPVDLWLFTIIGRIGTGLLHMLTAALNGWALTCAWHDRKYIQLGLVLFATVLIHGTWNLMAVLVGVGQAGDQFPLVQNLLPGWALTWALPGLSILMLGVLFITNRRLRVKAIPPPLLSETPPVIG